MIKMTLFLFGSNDAMTIFRAHSLTLWIRHKCLRQCHVVTAGRGVRDVLFVFVALIQTLNVQYISLVNFATTFADLRTILSVSPIDMCSTISTVPIFSFTVSPVPHYFTIKFGSHYDQISLQNSSNNSAY